MSVGTLEGVCIYWELVATILRMSHKQAILSPWLRKKVAFKAKYRLKISVTQRRFCI